MYYFNKKYYTLCLFIIALTSYANAQLRGFRFAPGQNKVEIPFRFENDFILIDVIFNNIFPTTFLFDTGSEHTILTRKEFSSLMQLKYHRTFTILGADLKTELSAHLIKNISLSLPNVSFPDIDMLVLEEDYFQFEEYTGVKIHGILGMDLFRLFTIKIDYKKKIITLYRPESFEAPKDYTRFPISIYRGKPYLNIKLSVRDSTLIETKLLLDTGANFALLLYSNTLGSYIPPDKLIPGKLGDGLGGQLDGFLGRIKQLRLSPFLFNNVITNFQEVNAPPEILQQLDRNGILGNVLLSRFYLILSPVKDEIFLKPQKRYNRGFKYDKSGLSVLASGLSLKQFTINNVTPNSPADEAGLQSGDVIKKINFAPARFYHLKDIVKKFQGRTNKRFKITFMRNGVKKKTSFRLRDLI